jgi:hypothetical protein
MTLTMASETAAVVAAAHNYSYYYFLYCREVGMRRCRDNGSRIGMKEEEEERPTTT